MGMGTTRAEGTPTQSQISRSLQVHEEKGLRDRHVDGITEPSQRFLGGHAQDYGLEVRLAQTEYRGTSLIKDCAPPRKTIGL